MLWKFISKSISPPTKFRDGKIPVLGLSTAVTFVPPIFCNLTPPIWSFLFLLHLCLNKAVCYSSTQWQLSHKKKKKRSVFKGIACYRPVLLDSGYMGFAVKPLRWWVLAAGYEERAQSQDNLRFFTAPCPMLY